MQAQAQSGAGATSKIPDSKFQIGTMVRLKDEVEQVRIAHYYNHGHVQEVIADKELFSRLKSGVQVIGIEILSNPVADLSSAAAEDSNKGLRFRLPPKFIWAFPDWQFELVPGQ